MVAPPSTATSPSSTAPPSPTPPPICRALPFTLGPANPCPEPLILGARGPAWFLLCARHTRRVHAPISIVLPAAPVPEPSPTGRARIAFRESDGMGLLAGLLAARVPPQGAAGDAPTRAVAKPTGRMFAQDVPEVEILLDDVDVAHGCSCCNRFETPGEPAYKRCGGCKARYYCSPGCQRNDWLMRHKEICALIKQGRFVDVERIELAGPMSEVSWQISDMMSALSGQPRPGARDWAKMGTDAKTAPASAPPSAGPSRPSGPAPKPHVDDESDEEDTQRLSDESEEGSDQEDELCVEDSDSDWEDEEDEDEGEDEESEEAEQEQEQEQEKADPAPSSGPLPETAKPLTVA